MYLQRKFKNFFMAAQFDSKHGIVSRPKSEIYMAFTDMRNFLQMLPEDKKQGVTADFDSITASVQGFNIGVRVANRVPYSKIELEDNGAPFKFHVTLNCEDTPDPNKTDFSINVEADLNMMMRMMVGGKVKEALDKIVDGLVDVSEGRMPEGMPKV